MNSLEVALADAIHRGVHLGAGDQPYIHAVAAKMGLEVSSIDTWLYHVAQGRHPLRHQPDPRLGKDLPQWWKGKPYTIR